MLGQSQDAVDDRAQQSPQDSQRYLFLGTALQFCVAHGADRLCRRDSDV